MTESTELAEKAKAKGTPVGEVMAGSVRDFPEKDMETGTSIMLWLMNQAEEVPKWWTPARDVYLRDLVLAESVLASTVYDVAARNASFAWELSGPPRQVRKHQRMLANANFGVAGGGGWASFANMLTQDLVGTDNGAFFEIIRPARADVDGKMWDAFCRPNDEGGLEWWAEHPRTGRRERLEGAFKVVDSPMDLPIGLASLDSGKVVRTGDPEWPAVYTDRHGGRHLMRWWQIVSLSDMPSTREDMKGVGLCATSRALWFARILRDVTTYKSEKVGGRFYREINFVNVNPRDVADARKQVEEQANNMGLKRFAMPLIIGTKNLDAAPATAKISLAGAPEWFDENDTMQWYISLLAMAFGVDYGFLAPLPGKGLGTSAQSETQARHARGKSSRQFMSMIEYALSYGGILPETVQFSFKEPDPEEEAEADAGRKTRAETRAIMIESGEITPQIARQMASDAGDMDKEYLALLGEEDLTPSVTAEDTDKQEAEDASVSAAAEEAKKPAVAEPADKPEEKPAETEKKGLFARVRHAFGRKDVDPETGKVTAAGKPLPDWTRDLVEIEPEDIVRAVRSWDVDVPEAAGLLTAPEATAAEELEAGS